MKSWRLLKTWHHSSHNDLSITAIPIATALLADLPITTVLVYGCLMILSDTYEDVRVTDEQLVVMTGKHRTAVQAAIRQLKAVKLISTQLIYQQREEACDNSHDHKYACYLTNKRNRFITLLKRPLVTPTVFFDPKIKKHYNLSDRETILYSMLSTGSSDTGLLYKTSRGLELATETVNSLNKTELYNIPICNSGQQPALKRQRYSPVLALNQAKKYIELGWSIIPIEARSKKPLVAWKEYQKRHATDQELEAWFGGKLTHQIGMAVVTGEISGITVLDSDALKYGLPLPDVSSPLTATSGSGMGKHYYFAYNGEQSGKNSSEHWDLQSDGHYVVIDPSVHESGFNYTWDDEPTVTLLTKLPRIPEHFLKPQIAMPLVTATPRIIVKGSRKHGTFEVKEYMFAGKGERNRKLFDLFVRLLIRMDNEAAYEIAKEVHATFAEPLPVKEFNRTFHQGKKYAQLILDKRQPQVAVNASYAIL